MSRDFSDVSERLADPIADSRALITFGKVRFTVLTSQLIRMEWSKNEKFEDRPSLIFINRKLSVPFFKVGTEKGWHVVKTEKLELRYKKGSGKFTAKNLRIEFALNGKRVIWKPGMKDTANLRGTACTLDGIEGATELESGILSRDGWVVIDDSQRPLFDQSDWRWVVPRTDMAQQDWYFFGHGHDYKQALYDFTLVAGKIPMPPRFTFGLWWSRYWAYTDKELKQLVGEFETHDVPLDVLVIDMDWHQTFGLRWGKSPKDQAGQPLGWTGYTWNKNFFPDPSDFLKWCKSKGLKITLNLHPASGIQPHEELYPKMARAMGIAPKSNRYIPFDIVDKKFTMNYLNIVIRPLEEQGVDFWWLDWQQWETTKIKSVSPTWWLNHVFFSDMERRGNDRPVILHRWGGLGNHRYQIGFSGDMISVWKSLAFQPYFTATAANVGYGYWSHDIGGHQPGHVTAELYTRWIQFGVFSPILRTHTTKNPEAERRIWAYPPEYYQVMRDAVLLRYALIPYVYNAARRAYDTGISICRPMYYDYPKLKEAYDFKDQYMFGDSIIVAPITSRISPNTILAEKKIWLPEGEWFEWYTGTRLRGPAVVKRSFALDEIPVYVKAGSIIPMQPKMKNTHEKPVDPLIITVFPGNSCTLRYYEDDGRSVEYQRGKCCWTTIRHSKANGESMKIEILPVEGSFSGMLTERGYEIRLPGMLPPKSVRVNRKAAQYTVDDPVPGWWYDGDKLMTVIALTKFNVHKKMEVVVKFPTYSSKNDRLVNGFPGKLARLRRVMTLINNQWHKEWSPDSLVAATQTGNRIGLKQKNALKELESFDKNFSSIIEQIEKLNIEKKVIQRALNHLGCS